MDADVRTRMLAPFLETLKSHVPSAQEVLSQGSTLLQFLAEDDEDLRLFVLHYLSFVPFGAVKDLLIEGLAQRATAEPVSLYILHASSSPEALSFLEHNLPRSSALLQDAQSAVSRHAFTVLTSAPVPLNYSWVDPSLQYPLPRTTSITTFVHGTGARKTGTPWWKWPSAFCAYIDGITGDVYKGSDPFFWSGKNADQDRRGAATSLKAWIDNHPCDELTLIAHSHGGNVALLATREGAKIDKLILLGTPIRSDYTPFLQQIEKSIANVYSFGDHIQTPTGSIPHTRGEGRTLADTKEVVNYLTSTNVGHSDLHEPWLWAQEAYDSLLR